MPLENARVVVEFPGPRGTALARRAPVGRRRAADLTRGRASPVRSSVPSRPATTRASRNRATSHVGDTPRPRSFTSRIRNLRRQALMLRPGRAAQPSLFASTWNTEVRGNCKPSLGRGGGPRTELDLGGPLPIRGEEGTRLLLGPGIDHRIKLVVPRTTSRWVSCGGRWAWRSAPPSPPSRSVLRGQVVGGGSRGRADHRSSACRSP